ncbi:hypothetical protein C367_01493, partial [Cryptococcus neoformans Ze90-1]
LEKASGGRKEGTGHRYHSIVQ